MPLLTDEEIDRVMDHMGHDGDYQPLIDVAAQAKIPRILEDRIKALREENDRLEKKMRGMYTALNEIKRLATIG